MTTLAQRIEYARRSLATMPANIDPRLRPVVVQYLDHRCYVGTRYAAEPIGTVILSDSSAQAVRMLIVADLTTTGSLTGHATP